MSTGPAAPRSIVAAVILAAGESRRMGRFKLLLPWRGRPVLDHVLRAVRASKVHHRILVLGHQAGAVRAALDLDGFTVCENPDYPAGQSTSMQAGLAAAPAECSGFLFLLGDQPAITPGFINAMSSLHGVEPDRILVPTVAGRRTSPVLFPVRLRDALLAVRGDQGGRPVLDAHPDLILPVPVDDPDLLRDLDAPSDLESP
jgi:molybdenum cofactor cytidylyltransferase